MTDAVIGIAVDGSRAEAGARVVRRNLDEIDRSAARSYGSTGRLSRSFDDLGRRGTGALGSLRGALERVNPLLTALGAGLSVAALQSFARNTLSMADAIAKTADRVGVGIEALQEYRYAAGLAGVQSNTLDMALQRLTRRFGEAVQGKGELIGVLKQYNIATTDAEGRTRTTEAVFDDLANTIASVQDPAEQLRIAFKAFDSEGAGLVNMLRDGSGALAVTRQEARDLGLVLSDDLARGAERANDELERLFSVLRVNAQQGFLQRLLSESTDLRDVYSDPLLQRGMRGVGEFIAELARDALGAVVALGALVELLRNPSLDNAKQLFSNIGIARLGREVAEAMGLIDRSAADATETLEKAAKAGSVTLGTQVPAAIRNTTTALELQNEKLALMAEAVSLGEGAVNDLNDALATYDALVKAEILPETAGIVDSMEMLAANSNSAAGEIAGLVKSNADLERHIKGVVKAQEESERAAADALREQQRQQEAYEEMMATPARNARKEVADRLARLFAEALHGGKEPVPA
ncbi:hypothetical protein [Oceanibaculum sp.]|uniref:hypothetical protein n=1 Tax=Oceanibaculum sp. TaxID=1903597 RepID=UPI002585A2EC|nr:hypothetical protein [Oceanibaculum sp.]MCH2393218.1 hypothetical protein [Oceanibaculum sp.]